MFWFVLTTLVLLLAYLGEEESRYSQNKYIYARILLVLVLSYAVALCGEGTDMEHYIKHYNYDLADYRSDFWDWIGLSNEDMEIGFIVICRICNLLGLSAIGMIFIVTIITNCLIVKTFYRFKDPVMVFFLYLGSLYYLQQTNLVRQMLAVSICLYSLKYIVENDVKKYLLGVFIAFLFHKSSMMMLLFAPLCYPNKVKAHTVKMVIMIIWAISLLSALKFLPVNMMGILGFLSGTRYDMYFGVGMDLGVTKIHFEWLYNLFVIYYLMFGKDDQKNIIYPTIFIMGCVVLNFTLNVIIIQRMSYFFTPMYCAYLPSLIAENGLTSKQKGKIGTYSLYALAILYHGRGLLSRMTGDFQQIGGTIRSISEIFR